MAVSSQPPPLPESDRLLKPQAVTATTIFTDSFSGAHPGAWTIGHDGGGGNYAWAWPSGYAHAYADPGGSMYFYPDDLHVFMERRGISLAGYNTATLSFYRIVDTEATFDELTVNVRDQSGTWHYIDGWSGPTDPLDWTYTELNLDQFAGQTNLYIQFRFDSDGTVSGDPYSGAYIDTVLLTADTAGDPDLQLDHVQVSIDATGEILSSSASVPTGTLIRIDEGTKNCGAVEADDFYIGYYDNGSLFDDDLESSAVSPDCSDVETEYTTETFGVGNHILSVCTDDTDVIAESNEGNNCQNFVLNVVDPADLQIDSFEISNNATGEQYNSSDTVSLGTELFVRVYTKNCGGADAADFYVEYSDNGVPFDDDLETSTVTADCSDTETETTLRTPTLGSHILSVCADSTEIIPESNEGNNCQNFVINVDITTAPDITVDPTSLEFQRFVGSGGSSPDLSVAIPTHVKNSKAAALYTALETSKLVPAIVHLNTPLDGVDSLEEQSDVIAISQDAALDQLSPTDFVLKRKFSLSPGFSGWVSKDGLDKLLKMSNVSLVYENEEVSISLAESLPLIRADQVHSELGYTGTGVGVAVLDTGIDPDHQDLGDDLMDEHCFTNGVCPPSNTNESSSADDGHGHGTNVSGVISSAGAIAPLGVAPDAGIVAVKVMNDSGRGSVDDWVEGINWVVANHSIDTSVINMSLSTDTLYSGVCDSSYPDLATAVNTAVNSGITVFAASGNNGSDSRIGAPACLTNVVSVGAVYDADVGSSPSWCLDSSCTQTCNDSSTAADLVTCFTNSNTLLDLLAPSYRNRTSGLNNGIKTNFGGTSAASPHAAAAAALMLDASPGLTPAEVLSRLESTGVPVTHPDTALSYPRIDAFAAVSEGNLTIGNLGDGDLLVTNISKLGGSCWLNISPPQGLPFTVSPSQQALVEINVDASCVAAGNYNDTIRISSNDPDQPTWDVPVTLHAIPRPYPDLTVSSPVPSANPPYHVGQSVDWEVVSTNEGDAASPETDVGYYLGTSCNDLSNQVDSDSVDALDPDAFDVDHDAYTFASGDVGTRYLIVWVDYEDLADESIETNNQSCYGPFEIEETYQLTTSVDPAAAGTVTPNPVPNAAGNKYIDGTVVGLAASPVGDFDHWSGDIGGASTTNPNINVTMNQDRNITAHFSQSTVPGPFGKTSPVDGVVVGTSITVSWEESAGADSYELCADTTDDDSCDGDNWTPVGSSTSHNLTGLVENNTYYWQIRARNTTGTTEADAGAWWSVTVSGTDPFNCVSGTGNNATVMIPTTANIIMNTPPIFAFETGDVVAVFTPDESLCVGEGIWNGSNLAITVWGDNVQTTEKDGIATGELMKLMIWDQNEDHVYERVDPTYSQGNGQYAPDSLHVVASLTIITADTQEISLVAGWNMISSYVESENPDMWDVFDDIIADVVIVKNGAGVVFWPEYGVNNIGNWNAKDGYQVYMAAPATLSITGTPADPTLPNNLPAGWSLIAFLRDAPMPIEEALDTILDKIIIVKDGDGKVYWPEYGVDNIVNLEPGKGYQLYLSAPGTLMYPPND